MEIRNATLDDVEQIYEIMKDNPRDAYTKDLVIDLIENRQSICLVSTENNQIIGSVGARGEGKKSCWLYYIVVKKKFRSMGYARGMIERFFDVAKKRKIKRIALDTPEKEFFERFDFKEVGRLPKWYEDKDQILMYMTV